MTKKILITASPRDAVSGAAVVLRMAGGGTTANYHGGNHYRSGITEMLRLAARIEWSEEGWTGGVVPSTGTLAWAPSGKADLAASAAYYWRNAAISIDELDESTGTIVNRLTGKVADAIPRDDKLNITVADLAAGLDRPVVTARFAGTGGIEGGAEAAGRIRRRTWGRAFNIPGRIFDKTNNIYEFGDDAYPWQAFDVIRDGGRDGAPAPAVLAWQGSIAATLAALVAAAPAQGSGVAAPSISKVKWWTQPHGPLTADVRGEIGAGYVETCPEIAARILAAVGGPTITNAATAAAWRAGVAGIHVDEGENINAALTRLLMGVSLHWIFNPSAGTITLREFTFSSPVASLVSDDVSREQTLRPMKTRRVGYQRSYHLHSDGDIVASLLQSDPTAGAKLDGIAAGATKNAAYRQVGDPRGTNTINPNDLWVELVSPMRIWIDIGGTWQTAANYVTAGADIGVENGATKNNLYRQTTTPVGAGDGAFWEDISQTPNLLKQRIAGVWQVAANLVTQGADIGVANGATSDLNLYKRSAGAGTLAIQGNSIARTDAGASWDTSAVSKESYLNGADVRAKLDTVRSFFGLTDAPLTVTAGAHYVDADYYWHYSASTGTFWSSCGGSSEVNHGAVSNLDSLRLFYDSGNIVWEADGIAVRVLPTVKDRRFSAIVGFNAVSSASRIRFTPYTDVTAISQHTLTVAPGQTVQYDYTGSSTTQLPKILQNTMKKGDLDVTASTSFVYTATGCTIDTTGLAAGQVRLNTVTAVTAYITVTATVAGGASQIGYISVTRTLGSNPGSSGGGSGASSFGPVSISASISDTSYDGSPQVLASAQMQANGSGQIRMVLNAEYSADGGQSVSVNAKAQRSTDNSSWTDMGLSATGSTSTGGYYDTPPLQNPSFDDWVPGTTGTVSANALVGGMAAGTTYYVRWIAYKAGSQAAVGVYGSASGSQS